MAAKPKETQEMDDGITKLKLEFAQMQIASMSQKLGAAEERIVQLEDTLARVVRKFCA